MQTSNEVIKERIFQTASKKVLRSFEKQKARMRIPYTHYVRAEDFVHTTVC